MQDGETQVKKINKQEVETANIILWINVVRLHVPLKKIVQQQSKSAYNDAKKSQRVYYVR